MQPKSKCNTNIVPLLPTNSLLGYLKRFIIPGTPLSKSYTLPCVDPTYQYFKIVIFKSFYCLLKSMNTHNESAKLFF